MQEILLGIAAMEAAIAAAASAADITVMELVISPIGGETGVTRPRCPSPARHLPGRS
jgi:hypothetical protein